MHWKLDCQGGGGEREVGLNSNEVVVVKSNIHGQKRAS